MPKPKVLIVDDHPAIVDIIQRILLLDGRYDPIVAYDGIAALERFDEEHPDCMIIDVKMPGLNGFQLLRTLRGDSDSANTALVMLTALVQPQDERTGMFSGADIYLTKPFKADQILAAIEAALRITPEERTRRLRTMDELW